MTAAMAASLAACGNSTTNTGSTTNASSSDAAQTSDAAATESAAGTSSDGKKYTIGICQQLEHPALDQATQGFEDALTELLGADNVTFDLQNAQGRQTAQPSITGSYLTTMI
jgi:putative ABC transport system substrate-binding protein